MTEMKTFVMALSFTNGKYIEIGIEHTGVDNMKERAFKALKDGDIMECENICFRCADVCFVAFFEKKMDKSEPISQDKISSDQGKNKS